MAARKDTKNYTFFTCSRDRKVPNLSQMSKSCEDLTRHQKEKPPQPTTNGGLHNGVPNNLKIKSSRKFTFQSTIRQIERKRIADKLSKEAEEKGKSHRGDRFDPAAAAAPFPMLTLYVCACREKKTTRIGGDEKGGRRVSAEEGTRKSGYPVPVTVVQSDGGWPRAAGRRGRSAATAEYADSVRV